MALFEKTLTPTDTTKRLSVPAKALPSLVDFREGHSADLQVTFGDQHWIMSCTKRTRGYGKPVLSKGWLHFVRHNKLKAGDRVSLYKEEKPAGDGSSVFRIRVKRSDCPAAAPQRKVRVRNAMWGSMHSGTGLDGRTDPDVGTCRYGSSVSGYEQRMAPLFPLTMPKKHIDLEAPAESQITWDGGSSCGGSDLVAGETEGPNLELMLALAPAPPTASTADDLVQFRCIDFLGIGGGV